jgi:hypothetical protein
MRHAVKFLDTITTSTLLSINMAKLIKESRYNRGFPGRNSTHVNVLRRSSHNRG